MGRVAEAMRDAGIDQSEIDDYLKRAMAGDYGGASAFPFGPVARLKQGERPARPSRSQRFPQDSRGPVDNGSAESTVTGLRCRRAPSRSSPRRAHL